ncbi:hypothetical protein, partial [Mobiluncus sp.]|uniref:hypothetical protein n=1 Tax=Mobiluncus sp. TaxID=47293 RepID=UPI002A917FE5
PEKPDKHGPHQIRKPQKHKQKHPKKGTKKRVNKKQNAIEIKTNKPTRAKSPSHRGTRFQSTEIPQRFIP